MRVQERVGLAEVSQRRTCAKFVSADPASRELNRWPRTHKKYESAMGSERVQVSDTARSASLAHHLKAPCIAY